MAVRRLYEPLCIAFGTTVSSPTVPTYQLYDLPHKFTPRLYMESEDPNLVLREIGVWAGWEQAGSANTRSFLLDLLKDEGAGRLCGRSVGNLCECSGRLSERSGGISERLRRWGRGDPLGLPLTCRKGGHGWPVGVATAHAGKANRNRIHQQLQFVHFRTERI